MMKFENYVTNARFYENPLIEQDSRFIKLCSLSCVKEQFEKAKNKFEWCTAVEQNNNKVYYIVQTFKLPFNYSQPRLELKYVGPNGGEPTIKICVSESFLSNALLH